MQNIKLIFPYLLILPIFFPLLYASELFFPYITYKVLFLRGFSIVLLAVFLWKVLQGHSFYFDRLKQKITWIPGLLLLSTYISSLLNPGFFHGFWSSFERGDGLLTLTSTVVYFYIFLLYTHTEFNKKFFKAVSYSALLISVYAVLQWVQSSTGLDLPIIEAARGRVGGTFNNAAFLSGFLMLTIPITWYVLKEITANRVIKTSIALQILTVFLTATRGALVAMFVALLIGALTASFSKQAKVKKYSIVILVTILVGSSIFFAFRGTLQDSKIEFISRAASISLTDGTVANRIFVWKELLPISFEKPIFGHGSENIDVLFNRIFDPSEINEPWFDRSHNIFVDYLVQFGVAGLMLFISIPLYLLWCIKRRGDFFENTLSQTTLILIVLYFVHNFFVFETALSSWLFIIFFAAFLSMQYDRSEERELVSSQGRVSIVPFVLLLLLIPVVMTPYTANKQIVKAHNALLDGDLVTFSGELKKGYDLGSYADIEYGYTAYNWYFESILSNIGDDQSAKFAFETVHNILVENYKKYPDDTRTVIYLAHILSIKPDIVQRSSLEFQFEEVIEQVLVLSPKRDEAWFILINNHLIAADMARGTDQESVYYNDAIDSLNQYIHIVPDDPKPYFVLANIYFILGDEELMMEYIKLGERAFENDIEAARHAMRLYINLEDWGNALRHMEIIANQHEVTPELVYDLAKLYFLNEDYESAVVTYRRIEKENQGLVESDPTFMSSITPYLNQYE